MVSSSTLRKTTRRSGRNLQIETLESRQLMATNVFAKAAVVDDRFEENDTILQATNLGQVQVQRKETKLALLDANDYYKFVLPATGVTSSNVQINFTNSTGNLNLDLLDGSGKTIGRSATIANQESISLNRLGAGTYYARVYGNANATNKDYTLTINTVTAVDDNFENNDSRGSASDLGTVATTKTLSGLKMADTEDWFKFTTTSVGATTSFAAIDFTHAQGNLNVELFSNTGSLLGRSNTLTNREQLSLKGLAQGTYFLRVYGEGNVYNPSYSLSINATPTPAPAPAPPTPAPSTPVTPTSGTPTTPTSTPAFDIQLNMTGLTPSQQAIFERAAQRWEQVIVGDVPNATFQGRPVDDLLIDAKAKAIDGVGNILGQAGPDAVRAGSYLPIHGIMEFDSADLASLESRGTLFAVVLHEMGHVLGIGTIWNAKRLLTGAGTSNPRFIGPNATAAFNALYGRSDSGVPVENDYGPGTRDAHWDEQWFGNEVMTGIVNNETTLPLSRVTIGSLADLGYTVNMNVADQYTPPPGTVVTTPSNTISRSTSTTARSVQNRLSSLVNQLQDRIQPNISNVNFLSAANATKGSQASASPSVDEVFGEFGSNDLSSWWS